MDYKEKFEYWLSDPYFDEETRDELFKIKDDDKEIKERFSVELEFGTAGLRGIMGAGTNRMNKYIIRKATQGLANYILKSGSQDMGVAIAYDSRNNSKEFSEEAALCLAANGIRAYIFDSLRPTPELSFVIRELRCISGINVTASHNPPEYNGYKVYWEDGSQITPPHDAGIMKEVENIKEYSEIKTIDKQTAVKNGLYTIMSKEVDDLYLDYLKSNVINVDLITKYASDLKIVYTPLNGAGNIMLRTLLSGLGFNNVHVVKEQEAPDGNFPTLKHANPESEEIYEYALKLAKDVDADLILATDPDADRLGIQVKDSNGNYHFLSGNITGCMMAEYILSQRTNFGTLPENPVIIKTIVTSNLADAIAKNYNVQLKEVLTGFKWIGKEILDMETNNTGDFVFGFEESIGYLAGDNVRDKDSIISSMLCCEILAYCKSQNKTMWDYIIDIYKKYGYYVEGTKNIYFTGLEGQEKINSIMEYLRNNPLNKIGNYHVLSIRDYKKDIITDLKTGETSSTGLPSSNVIYYDLVDNGWVCARPSGTEPKIKFYYGLKDTSLEDANARLKALDIKLQEIINKAI